jgi:hypothetical protein
MACNEIIRFIRCSPRAQGLRIGIDGVTSKGAVFPKGAVPAEGYPCLEFALVELGANQATLKEMTSRYL